MSSERKVVGSINGNIRILNVGLGDCVRLLKGQIDKIFSNAKLTNEKIISGSNDGTIKLWNVDSGECLRTLVDIRLLQCVERLSNDRILIFDSSFALKVLDIN